MEHIKAPNSTEGKSKTIFLAGSIEMGRAIKWQDEVANRLKDTDFTIINPRRDDWDSSWEQKISNPEFFEQVNWELDNIDKSEVIVVYFDPNTQSPITLLELGRVSALENKLAIVICPEGFWRKGNVDIMCLRYGMTMVNDIDEMIEVILDHFN